MSAHDTLLVVHNPYGLQMRGGRPDADSLTKYVCYWLDHFLRPAGETRAAVDTIYYKQNSYDGRIVVQLSGDIRWENHREHLQRYLGEHRWAEFVRPARLLPAERGLRSCVFEFDKRCFKGRRTEVEMFGYSATATAPVRLHKYDRAKAAGEKGHPLVHWELYPAAHWCAIPPMHERLELPVARPQSPPVPTPAPSEPAQKTPSVRFKDEDGDSASRPPRSPSRSPVKVERNASPSGPVKAEPREASIPVKREPSRKDSIPVKREPSEGARAYFKTDDEEIAKEIRREQEEDLKPVVKKEEDASDDDEDDEDVRPKLEPEDVKLEEDEERKPRIKREDSADVKPKLEEVEDANFWIKREPKEEEEERKPLVKPEPKHEWDERETWSPPRSRSRSRGSASVSPRKRVKVEFADPPLKRVKLEHR